MILSIHHPCLIVKALVPKILKVSNIVNYLKKKVCIQVPAQPAPEFNRRIHYLFVPTITSLITTIDHHHMAIITHNQKLTKLPTPRSLSPSSIPTCPTSNDPVQSSHASIHARSVQHAFTATLSIEPLAKRLRRRREHREHVDDR